MRLAIVSRPLTQYHLKMAKQMGVSDIVATIPDVPLYPERVQREPSDFMELVRLRQEVEDADLKLAVIEGYQLSDRITLGLPGRDEDLDRVCTMITYMGAAKIPIYCYNFMAVFNWARTSTTAQGRGGALVTRYDHHVLANAPFTHAGAVADERMWENYAYFLERVLPVAEQAGVKLALHPDDPPISPIRGLARIMRSLDNLERAINLIPSDYHGLTLCQGTIASMGIDDMPAVIRRFGKQAGGKQNKIFFVHFRDVQGSVPSFQETFHDEGKTDMAACMRAYREIGFEGPMRPDHAPTMEGEDNTDPGYMMMGRLFAVGYMRGLIDAVWSEKA
jgi:mannonate dehydratase